jgi:hypothetical protein
VSHSDSRILLGWCLCWPSNQVSPDINHVCRIFNLPFFFCCHSYGQERYEKRDLQLRVRKQFEKLEKLDRAEGRVPWHIVSAAQSVDDVRNDIWHIVQKTLAQVKSGTGKPVGKLWEEGEYYTESSFKLTTSEDESEKENK